MKRIWVLAAALCVSGPALAAGVKNGSFEKPSVPSGQQSFFAVGQKVGPWKVVGTGNVGVMGGNFTENGHSAQAKNGTQLLNIAGNMHSQAGIEQQIKTVSGTPYLLSFYLGSLYDPDHGMGTSSTVVVRINGEVKASYTVFANRHRTDVTWQKMLVNFTAEGSKTTVTITNGDAANDSFAGVDGASLQINN